MIGLTLNIQVGYRIELTVTAKNTAANPYTIEVKAVADGRAVTDSSAGIRLVVVEGGVFIKGTLVKARTDPTATAKYFFSQQKIELIVIWYAELMAFNANWGFYWRRRKLGGWTGKMIIKQWSLNSIYKKWLLYQRTFTYNV